MSEVTTDEAAAREDAELLGISQHVALIIGISRGVEIDDVEAWARHARDNAIRHDTLGPILDPTAWQRDYAGIDASAAVAAAFLEFRRAIEKAVAR